MNVKKLDFCDFRKNRFFGKVVIVAHNDAHPRHAARLSSS
jgi:hypothetical protein